MIGMKILMDNISAQILRDTLYRLVAVYLKIVSMQVFLRTRNHPLMPRHPLMQERNLTFRVILGLDISY